MYLLATLQHDISGDEASDGLLDLEFVADRSGSSPACMKHRLGKKGEATLVDFVFLVLGTDSSAPGRNSHV